jgi:uncharacterized membrane protein YbhN (UPF0104 family)
VSTAGAAGEAGSARYAGGAATVIKIALSALVVAFAAWTLAEQWSDVRRRELHIQPRPGWILASSVVVIAAYAALIEAWRRVLAASSARVPFWAAARVWTASNLGKYVPGKVWQITAMSVMLRSLAVPVVTALGAAVIVTLANLLVGLAIVLALGASALPLPASATRAAALGVGVLAAALAAAPLVAPRLARRAERVLRRPVPLSYVPARSPWIAAAGSAVAWVLYGVAFRLFALGVTGHAPGSYAAYIAVFTGSYLVGYLALFAPGGIGARELALTASLPAFGLASPPEAAVLTVTSRLWLTVLELVPGLLALAVGPVRRR